MEVYAVYKGATNGYHIIFNGDEVHSTPSKYECDMFVAELKARIKLLVPTPMTPELQPERYGG